MPPIPEAPTKEPEETPPVPNQTTLDAIADAEAGKLYGPFSTVEELMAALDEE